MSVALLPGGGRIAYDVTGPEGAETILLVRPLGGWRGGWDGFSAALAKELRVVAFDARGTGESSSAPFRTTTRSMARDALALLDAIGTPRVHVYGISLGAMVASWIAIDAPERVARVVLASVAARGWAVRREPRKLLELARCVSRPPPEAEACLAARMLSDAFRRERPDRVEAIRACAAQHPASRRAFAVLLAAALRHDVRARDLHAETLVLAGERDRLVPPRVQRRFAERLPRAHFETIAAGHDLSAEAPEETAARVLAHVSRA